MVQGVSDKNILYETPCKKFRVSYQSSTCKHFDEDEVLWKSFGTLGDGSPGLLTD